MDGRGRRRWCVALTGVLGAWLLATAALAADEKAPPGPVAVRPDDASGHNKRGEALVEQFRWKEAIAEFGKAIQIKPDFAEAHANLNSLA